MKNDSYFGYPWGLHAYFTRGIIWFQRYLFNKCLNGINDHRKIPPDYIGQAANDAIRMLLKTEKPCLIARFGSVELDAILRGYDILRKNNKIVKTLKLFTGDYGPFWYDNSIRSNLLCTTGMFPVDDETLLRFSRQALGDAKELDILGSWNARELQLKKDYFPNCKAVRLSDLNPFFYEKPWSMVLEGKRVLVIHPFCKTIASQYSRRTLIFEDKSILPNFHLLTYKPVASFLGLDTPYKNWFEALDKMCMDISKIEFDVAIIGCGAYGMSIGAFIKRTLHRQAIHLGGVTQFLFGIKGTRWDNEARYRAFYNENWVRPDMEERPNNFNLIEGGAYW